MNISNIYLARHGQTEYNRCDQMQGRGIDISINETGRRQALAIADHLDGIGLHRIFSSSLKRSKETAQLIAEQHEIELESHADLDEMDFGVFEGRPASEVESQLQELHEKWRSGKVDYACQEGESPSVVLERADSKMKKIVNKHNGTNLLFVLHGRLIRIILSHWLQYGLQEMHRVPHTNGALYHLQWDGEIFEPIYLNYTDHLQNKA